MLGLTFPESIRPEDLGVHAEHRGHFDLSSSRLRDLVHDDSSQRPTPAAPCRAAIPSRTTAFCLLLFDTAGT